MYHNYAIADQPGTVRFGKQVVSWGESTFIHELVLTRLTLLMLLPSVVQVLKLKKALIPVNMFYVSQNLTDQLSMEAFYQLSWNQTVLDNCGTFFCSAMT